MAEFPGSTISAADSFEVERQRVRAAERVLTEGGQPTEGLSLILDSIDRKAAAIGPGISLTVRLDEEFTADGCVRRKDLQFLTDLPACHPSVQRFVRVLEALNVGPVETLEAGDADRRE